jgi:hypothetical protein
MNEKVKIELSKATIVDRLRTLQSHLSDENRHDEALIIELGIQTILQSVVPESLEWKPVRMKNNG